MANRYTGTQLTNFFSKIGMSEIVHDGTTKHKFLYNTLSDINQKDFNGTRKVIEQLCDPQEFFAEKEKHQKMINKINEVLSFYGLQINEKTGKLLPTKNLEGILQSQETELITKFDSRGYHPEIIRHSRSKFIKGDFFGAVFEACKAYEKKVSKKSGIEKHGSELMSTALSKTGVLKLNNGRTETERNFQEGIMHLSMGIMKAVRNPEGHEPALDWQVSIQESLDILSLLSYLNHQID